MNYVSIIIPTYNRANIIEKAIQSVLNQTYEYFELLVVDDGSIDDTISVVEAIGDERIRVLSYGENRGQAFARNYGVQNSSYDLIAFQDSDDEWHPEKLEKQMKFLEGCSDNVGMIYTKYHDDDGTIFPQDWVPMEQRSGDMFPYLLRCNMIGTPTMLLKKECFLAVGGFNASLRCVEDYEFVLRFAKEYRIAYLDENLLTVHDSKGSVNYQVARYVEAMLYIIDKWKLEMLQYDLLEYVIDDLLNKAARVGVEAQAAAKLQQILDFEV